MKDSGTQARQLVLRSVVLMLISISLLSVVLIGRDVSADAPARSKPDLRLSQYIFRSWELADGLQITHIRDIAQTEDGFLWVATTSGLARFDGLQATVFNLISTPSMISEYVNEIEIGPDQSLWLGFLRGGGLLQYKDGQFIRHSIGGQPDPNVSGLVFDDSGKLWIGTSSGLYWKTEEGIVPATEGLETIRNTSIRNLFKDSEGTIWIATDAGIYGKHDGNLKSFSVSDGLISNDVIKVVRDQNGILWAATSAGLDRISPEGLITHDQLTENLRGNRVWELAVDHLGRLWIGLDGVIVRIHENSMEYMSTESEMLPDPRVRSIFEDHDGSIWIGFHSGKFTRLRKGPISTFSMDEGLAENFVTSVFIDHNDTVWATTTNGVVHTIVDSDVETVLDLRASEHPGVLRSIAHDPTGNLWLGTERGLMRYANGRLTTFTVDGGLPSNRIRVVYLDPLDQSTLWIGTFDKGLCTFRNGRFTHIGVSEELTDENVRWVLRSRTGALWWGTESGLHNLISDQITTFTTADGLPTDVMRSGHESLDGTMWFGTVAGLVRYRNGKFFTYTTRDGLFDNNAWHIMEHLNHLWISSDLGIQRVPKDALEQRSMGDQPTIPVRHLGTADGMKDSECNGLGFPAGAESRDGAFWFPTMEGAVRVDPGSPLSDFKLPHAIITSVRTDFGLEFPEEGKTLEGGRHNLEIRYTAPGFITPENLRFRYTLSGYDEGWVEVGQRRTAYFTNLPAGEYTFHVRANYDSNSIGEAASFPFSLKPYLHETWWFITLSSIASLGVAGWFVVFLLNRQQIKTVKAETELAKAREALVRRTRFTTIGHLAANIAHELKNPLGAARNSAFFLKRTIDSKEQIIDEHLEIIDHEIGVAISTINEILAMTRDNPPDKRNTMVAEIAADVFRRIADEDEDLILELDIEPEEMSVFVDRAQFNQVLTNLISNAAQAMNHSGRIRLSARSSPDFDTITVTDKGPGVPKEIGEQIFEPLFTTKAKGSGLGLAICRQIIERHGGTISLEYQEVSDDKGASFRVNLPNNSRGSSDFDS